MYGKSVVKTARVADAVTLNEAKSHLKVSVTDDDDLIDDIIDAAQETVEAFTNRKLYSQTWYLYLDDFPVGDIVLPFSPVTSVTSVKYYDADDAEQTLVSGTDYYTNLNAEPATIRDIDGWEGVYDKPDAVTVEYVCGDTAPVGCKQAMLVLIADMYDNRVDMPRERFSTWKALAYPHRVFHNVTENEP